MTSKHFCLKWTKFQTSILNAFESLQSTEDLADVTLTCEGISLKAHKFILSACSPYFRTIFKENPCSHPIVILKDVAYIDLIALVNFMYHGEVMVAEEQLASFLQTATILQVSGLINNESPYSVNRQLASKKIKSAHSEPQECPSKKIKIIPKSVKGFNEELAQKKIISQSDVLEDEIVRSETQDEFDSNNEQQDVKLCDQEKMENQTQTSILEAALEVKSASILERSLTSQPTSGKSPSLPLSCEKLNILQVLPDISIPKTVFIPRKPPENELERLILRSSSESSSSPSAFDRPSEFLQQSIKIEHTDQHEMEIISCDDSALNFSKALVDTPHHSSQCGNCPHCGKVYSNQSALKYHVRLVHSDLTNMYCCHLCPESFDYREGYKKHMIEAHSVRN
ncbi:longitudinals lacking protein, isoforms H/M/V-like [Sitophilus oryzae]|uniref:Longitudinals lacking protein, isoforms H/M/V-like n=1 Tax=Sitophilus oryzae TaxID=7048 RepID=A0A6J2XLH1_SITOR|nr:longitudinals lacking protein, isoforms H/M/V-like [Sitophilus oryzae]XP_030752374.1 longitudinals lacking protein, isoforms H/M/V-like [Sitophilus oryzae]